MAKIPLSKQIGSWDNAQDEKDKQQTNNAIGEIKRCFNSDSNLIRIKNKGELEFKVTGSIAKSTDITIASDLDFLVIISNDYDFVKYKDYIENLLINKYGSESVRRGALSITVIGTTNRTKANIVPCKRIDANQVDALNDKTQKQILFFPDVDIRNVNILNGQNNSNYSKMVRSYKGLKNEMLDEGFDSARSIPSYMIECLLYNVNHDLYDINNKSYSNVTSKEQKYRKMFLDIKGGIFSDQLHDYEHGQQFSEINGKKDLFRNEKQWQETRAFFEDINDYLRSNYDINA